MFRATKILGYLGAMRQMGISAADLLAGTGIKATRVSQPDYLITLDQYHAVVANMIELTNNQGVAFQLANIVNLDALGIVGYAMLSASSLRQAAKVWVEYSNSLVGTPTNFESFRDMSPGYELGFTKSANISALHRFETEELLIQGLKLVKDLTNIKPVVGKVCLSYPKPRHHALYRKAFQCPIEFDSPRTVMRVLQPELGVPLRSANEKLFRMYSENCQQVTRSIPGMSQLLSNLRTLFLMTPSNLPDKRVTSERLGISVSTLSRHLISEGLNYQAIKDEFRFDLAREYLRSGHMAPKQVGYLLGFASPSTFSRVFRKWSGQTVGEFVISIRK